MGRRYPHLKRQRQVDVIIPLKANMLATQEAIQLAEMADKWQPHPSRADQTIALVRGVEHMWTECEVPLNACVIRFWNKKKKRTDHIVLVTTDLKLSAPWIVRHYEERPEIEQDYEQMKSGGWQLKKLSSTRYSEIVFYVLTVVLSYSLYHLFANTQAGARFADKTRQALAFEQLRTQRTHIIVYAGGYFEIFETLQLCPDDLAVVPTCARAITHLAGRASQPNSEARMTFPQRRSILCGVLPHGELALVGAERCLDPMSKARGLRQRFAEPERCPTCRASAPEARAYKHHQTQGWPVLARSWQAKRVQVGCVAHLLPLTQ